MALKRMNYIPSERMGIIWTLLNVKDSIVLEYGPAGTTHFSMNFFSKLVPEFRGRLFTTDMKEKDVVFGDTSQLVKAIKELDTLYGPKAIFVVNSTISSVIGTDLDGICADMQKNVNAKIIPISDISLSNDYTFGVAKAYKILTYSFADDTVEKVYGTYNILGASAYDYRNASDVWEYQNMLQEAFGYKMQACMSMQVSCDELSRLGQAEFNIVCSREALYVAKYLKDRFGTPFIYNVPYGYDAVLEFLEAVSQLINKDVNKAMQERIRRKYEKSCMKMYRPFRRDDIINKPAVYIEGNIDLVDGLCAYFTHLGFEVIGARYSYEKKALNTHSNAVFLTTDEEYMESLRMLRRCLVLGNRVTNALCDDSNIKLCVSNPASDLECVADHLPFVGEKGADYLQEYINLYLAM